MKKKERRVMLGMSFFGGDSYADAKKTAREFSSAPWEGHHICLGIETDGLTRKDIVDFLNERLSENWYGGKIYIWDKNCDDQFFTEDGQIKNLPSGLPMPFYKGFSYGGAVNRLLVLSKVSGCKYLVLVDPRTAPPYYFRELINHHIDIIDGATRVVSGQYTDRIALRDDFVPPEKLHQYYEFIHEYTGIDPRHNRQVTKGAALTMSVSEGLPSIPFPPENPNPSHRDNRLCVWATDDGFYKSILGDKALIIHESRIVRSDPGMAANIHRDPGEYPVRLASMVVINEMHKGSDIAKSQEVANRFLAELKDKKFCLAYSKQAATKMLARRIAKIEEGYRNYFKEPGGGLRTRWKEIIEKLSEIVISFPPDCCCDISEAYLATNVQSYKH